MQRRWQYWERWVLTFQYIVLQEEIPPMLIFSARHTSTALQQVQSFARKCIIAHLTVTFTVQCTNTYRQVKLLPSYSLCSAFDVSIRCRLCWGGYTDQQYVAAEKLLLSPNSSNLPTRVLAQPLKMEAQYLQDTHMWNVHIQFLSHFICELNVLWYTCECNRPSISYR